MWVLFFLASVLLTQADERTVMWRRLVTRTQNTEITRQPHYVIGIRNYFVTSDGTALSTDCTFDYAGLMQEESLQMGYRVNQRIAGDPDFCSSNKQHIVDASSLAAAVTGNRGQFILHFLLYPENNTTRLYTTLQCGNDVMGHVISHTNWPNPILPTVPGCPGISFHGNNFERDDEDWECRTD